MMKIVASLIILGLCANVAFGLGATPVVTSQLGAFSSSVLNSTIIQVLKGSNSTDAANWDSSSTTTAVAGVDAVYFGAGATNDTSYLWGIPYGSTTTTVTTGDGSCGIAGACSVSTLGSIRKRTINNTIVGWGNDTVEASVIGDTSISTSIMGSGSMTATTGPGYLVILSTGIDSTTTPNNQVWITLVSGVSGSATSTKVTSTSDTVFKNTGGTTPAAAAVCVATSFGVGNVWYDRGTGAFFYTFWKKVATSAATASGSAGTCGSITNAYSIYLGGIYSNGTVFLTTPISASTATATNAITSGSLLGGGDNTNAAANIYIVYKDSTALTTYVSKTAISANTSAVGSFNALVKDTSTGTGSLSAGAGTDVVMTYVPTTVWSSNNSYAITVSNVTSTTVWTGSAGQGVAGTPTYYYGWTNYFNGTTTGVDSGISSTTSTQNGYMAWQLNTGYTVVAGQKAATGTPEPTTYTVATYWANGTVNSTAATAGTLSYGAPQFYEDVNGTQWIGWYDEDTANDDLIYNAYLAKFQGQLNIPSGANVLSALSFVAVFLASIFIF